MSTPEVHGEVEPYGPHAARFTRRHLAGRVVWLEKDVSETDRYGRALRYVWLVEPPERPTPAHVREGMFNAILLLEGSAQVVTYPPDVRYADLFVRFPARGPGGGARPVGPAGCVRRKVWCRRG
ncbi:thermonuclease family protein [Thermaerobacter sp. FW80]|uniref:thermonuclease family protein n=1 Tax=Thermaerobacter sp. FW80 TaxID=2546351 RepID=UPI001FAA3D95|nr:thermonuclease family protein [Thermaerobacter sp. FW80]